MCQIHRIIGKLRSEETWKISNPASCWEQEQLWDQTTLLRTLLSKVLKSSKAAQPLWATLLAYLCGEGFPYTHMNILFQFMPIASHPPAVHHGEEPGSVFSVSSSQARGAAVRTPNLASALGWASPRPSASATAPAPRPPAHRWTHISNPLLFNSMPYKKTPNPPKPQTTAYFSMYTM